MAFRLFRRKQKPHYKVALIGHKFSKSRELLEAKGLQEANWNQFREVFHVAQCPARHKNLDFNFIYVIDGARCSSRAMWRHYVTGKHINAYICVVGDLLEEGIESFYRVSSKLHFLMEMEDERKIVVFLYHYRAPEEEQLFPEFQVLMEQVGKKHRVASFIYNDEDESVDAAFDWMVDEIAKDEAEKLRLAQEKKAESSSVNWMTALAKKVLSFGAAPHNP